MPDSSPRQIRVDHCTGQTPLFELARQIRLRVFVEEQSVPIEEEWDALDSAAHHLVALVDGRPAGTLRFHEESGWLHIGRVAVLPEYRSTGLGRLLMEECLSFSKRHGLCRSYLNAQTDKVGFYRKFGYNPVGGEFFEAGISHYRMERLE